MYVREGSLVETASLWREYLGTRAAVQTKAEAIAAGLFGNSVSMDSEDRMGDLIVIPHDDLILIDPDRVKQESGMVGHHGGLTSIETQVPLLALTK